MQDGNCFSHHYGKIQLHGALDLLLLALRDIRSDTLCRSLHRFGGYFQISQYFHLLAAVLERRVGAHHRQHAPHTRRVLAALDIEFHINRKLAFMTMRA